MFFPEGRIRVALYGEPCDMRRSFDGLQVLVRQGLGADPLDGGLYVFINRRATQMRVLYFDRSGFCIWSKRLEAGRFISDWRQIRSRQMDWTELKLMLEGMEVTRQRKRYRYEYSKDFSSDRSAQKDTDVVVSARDCSALHPVHQPL
jgi:transposase